MKTALRINTDFTTEILDLEVDSLTQLQEAVGGLVEAADLHDDLTLWCNEEVNLSMECNQTLLLLTFGKSLSSCPTSLWATLYSPAARMMKVTT